MPDRHAAAVSMPALPTAGGTGPVAHSLRVAEIVPRIVYGRRGVCAGEHRRGGSARGLRDVNEREQRAVSGKEPAGVPDPLQHQLGAVAELVGERLDLGELLFFAFRERQFRTPSGARSCPGRSAMISARGSASRRDGALEQIHSRATPGGLGLI
jgi:hypothetical protein